MKDDGEIVPMVLDDNSNVGLTEYSPQDEHIFNGVDLSAIPVDSLIKSNEWQMRMYGYKKALQEIDSINISDFENVFINSIINDKNVSSQNLGLKFMTKYIDHFGLKMVNLPAIWKDNVSEMLIKKTLINSKTSFSSIDLAFSFFEQSLLRESGDINKVDYLWDEMIDFINNNRKSKGIAIKQIFGIAKLFSCFIYNYGVEFSPIVKWSKAIVPLVTDCSDKNTKDCVYEILSMINQGSPLMESISSMLTPLQLKEVQKRSIEVCSKNIKDPIRINFVENIKGRFNSNVVNNSSAININEDSIDSFDLIEPTDVTKMLPQNWLEVISDKEVKWSERKAIVDQFCKLCETYKKLSISQSDNKVNVSQNKKDVAPSISDYQNLFNILQRIVKCEGNTTLILSVIRLCTNLVNCLRGKITTIVRPLTTQVMTKIKDQNKIVCTESINFIKIVLKFSLNLDQIFDDLYQYGYKEKVATAKCSAISICNHLIDEIIENNNALERHSKGLKQLINVIPPCFDDASIQVRSSASVLLVKLKNPCFGQEINSILQKIISGLNFNKQKLVSETEKKLGIHLSTASSGNILDNKNINSKTEILSIKATNPPPNSTIATPNNETAQSNKKSLSKIKHYKQIEVQKKSSFDIARVEDTNSNSHSLNLKDNSKIDAKLCTKIKTIESPSIIINEKHFHNLEALPTILNSISSKSEQKINFFERLSSKNQSHLQNLDKSEKQDFYYIDPTDKRNFIINLPDDEFIFEKFGSDLLSLKDYIEPFISEHLFINMFSNDKIQIDFSVSFWERFFKSLKISEIKKFTLFYFFFRWITYNLEMEILANYERIIIFLINIFLFQGREHHLKHKDSMIYNIILAIINIISQELRICDKSNILSEYEISKYEKIILLIMESSWISNACIDDERKQESLNQLTNTSFILNTVINTSLESLENFDMKISWINNHLNLLSSNSSNFIKSYGISNIYSLIKFVEHNSIDDKVFESINKILSRISDILGAQLWNSFLSYFPDIPIEKYHITKFPESLNNRLHSNLIIINSLEYETVKLFNIIGSTGNPKDTGVLYSDSTAILKKILTNLEIINGKLTYILENNNEIIKVLDDDHLLTSLLIESITLFSEISIHIYFSLTKLETSKYLAIRKIFRPGKLGEQFFNAIEFLDKFTNAFQSIVIKTEFPIKELMSNTLFIMSNYLLWKEHINDENQKIKLVNSLNNIMGVNIILSFQKELPRLIKIIIEVILFGIKPNNQTIFDHDLLNRLLPKVLRRMKVYLSKNSISDFQIKSISHCFELVFHMDGSGSSELIIVADFALEYLLLLLENGMDIQNGVDYVLLLTRIFDKLDKEHFQSKIQKIKSLL